MFQKLARAESEVLRLFLLYGIRLLRLFRSSCELNGGAAARRQILQKPMVSDLRRVLPGDCPANLREIFLFSLHFPWVSRLAVR